MNSKQRRKIKREHPHHITVTTAGAKYYYEYDRKVNQAVQWCVKNCKGTFKCNTDWDSAVFKFSNHKDATIFALKWV